MKLNTYYHSLLEPIQLEIHVRKDEWGNIDTIITTISEKNRVGYLYPDSYDKEVADHYVISCCGISELKFGMVHNCGSITEDKDYFDELIAKTIENQLSHKDERILITGLPVICPSGQYREAFYERLHKTLLSFGMIQLNKEPYVNKNSGNSIVVLVGQYK